jgi:quinol monooxygenase YgiN
MYASTRRIKCKPGKAQEVAQRIEEQFVPQMRTVAGFVGYYLVDVGDDEISSISIFQNQAGAEQANQMAGAWTKQTLGDIVAGPLEARAGEVLVNAQA